MTCENAAQRLDRIPRDSLLFPHVPHPVGHATGAPPHGAGGPGLRNEAMDRRSPPATDGGQSQKAIVREVSVRLAIAQTATRTHA